MAAEATPTQPQKVQNATPKKESGAPLHQNSGGGGPFTKDPKCIRALTCSACADLPGGHCFWNTALAKCIVGDPTKLMCALDTLAGNVVYLIIASVIGCVLLVICVACGVCVYKKRQNAANEAAVDSDEAFEARVPLTEEGGSRSFLRRSDRDDQVETF